MKFSQIRNYYELHKIFSITKSGTTEWSLTINVAVATHFPSSSIAPSLSHYQCLGTMFLGIRYGDLNL